jgi:uncharacterized protein (DUF58 family)
MADALLDPQFLRRLEQLQLASRKVFVGRHKGERKSRMRGVSCEFADYRNYVRGDDLRFVDWNIYARLERLFLKLFMEEQDLTIHLLLDTSLSMDSGQPNKLEYARKLAASLGYIGLAGMDRVCVQSFSNKLDSGLLGIRSKKSIFKLFDYLTNSHADGSTSLIDSLKKFAVSASQKGIVIILSDFLDPSGYEEGIRALLARRFEVCVIHILSPQEMEPELEGHLRLLDSEWNDFTDVTVNRRLMEQYKKTLKSFCGGLESYCRRHDVSYLFSPTSLSFESVLMGYLRRMGVVA